MGCTRAEFFRTLPGATRHVPLRDCRRHHHDPRPRRLRADRDRREAAAPIASIALPVLGVTFRFTGLDDAARDEFLAWFDLYTRRGGG